MGLMTTLGMIEAEQNGLLDNGMALSFALSSNFYPPLPQFVRDSITKAIPEYNNGEITIEELKEKCYLRTTDLVYKYFGPFLTAGDNNA